MFEEMNSVDEDGLFGLLPAKPLFHDPHAAARQQQQARREQLEKEDLARRVKMLPSREEMAVMAMDLAQSQLHPDTKIKAMQLAAQLLGYNDKVDAKAKKGSGGSKIMPVPVAATPAQWENEATSYMKKLERMANG